MKVFDRAFMYVCGRGGGDKIIGTNIYLLLVISMYDVCYYKYISTTDKIYWASDLYF